MKQGTVSLFHFNSKLPEDLSHIFRQPLQKLFPLQLFPLREFPLQALLLQEFPLQELPLQALLLQELPLLLQPLSS